MTPQDLMNMNLHDEFRFESNECNNEYWALRVVGGHIYSNREGGMVFVPDAKQGGFVCP